MSVRDAINYAHDLVVKCGKLDLPHKMEAHTAIDRIEAAHKEETAVKDATIAHHEKVNDEQDTAIVKLTKELHDTERFLNWLMLSEKIGTWCKQQVEHRAKGVRKALAAAEGGAI